MDDLDRREAEYRGRLAALREALALLPKSELRLPPDPTPKEAVEALKDGYVRVMRERTTFAQRLTDLFNETETEFRLIRQQRNAGGPGGAAASDVTARKG